MQQQYALALEALFNVQTTLMQLHKTHAAAKRVAAELRMAMQIRETELGISHWECDCGRRTTNEAGCEICLEEAQAKTAEPSR
jgi:hypothetical protein